MRAIAEPPEHPACILGVLWLTKNLSFYGDHRVGCQNHSAMSIVACRPRLFARHSLGKHARLLPSSRYLRDICRPSHEVDPGVSQQRSEEHTSELQSPVHL